MDYRRAFSPKPANIAYELLRGCLRGRTARVSIYS